MHLSNQNIALAKYKMVDIEASSRNTIKIYAGWTYFNKYLFIRRKFGLVW